MILLAVRALVIDSAQLSPVRISRGAIQHRIPSASRAAQIASATILSFEEWEIKTSCAITSPPSVIEGSELPVLLHCIKKALKEPGMLQIATAKIR